MVAWLLPCWLSHGAMLSFCSSCLCSSMTKGRRLWSNLELHMFHDVSFSLWRSVSEQRQRQLSRLSEFQSHPRKQWPKLVKWMPKKQNLDAVGAQVSTIVAPSTSTTSFTMLGSALLHSMHPIWLCCNPCTPHSPPSLSCFCWQTQELTLTSCFSEFSTILWLNASFDTFWSSCCIPWCFAWSAPVECF